MFTHAFLGSNDIEKSRKFYDATMKIPGMDRPYFSKGERAGCLRPANLEATDLSDERNRGKRKLALQFELPRGSYATMLVKRIAAAE